MDAIATAELHVAFLAGADRAEVRAAQDRCLARRAPDDVLVELHTAAAMAWEHEASLYRRLASEVEG